jgi:hypothetical protein
MRAQIDGRKIAGRKLKLVGTRKELAETAQAIVEGLSRTVTAGPAAFCPGRALDVEVVIEEEKPR